MTNEQKQDRMAAEVEIYQNAASCADSIFGLQEFHTGNSDHSVTLPTLAFGRGGVVVNYGKTRMVMAV